MNGSVSTASVNGSTPTSVNGGTSGPAVRELNYAELDLPKSNAIGFPQTARQNGSAKSSQPTLQNGSAAVSYAMKRSFSVFFFHHVIWAKLV